MFCPYKYDQQLQIISNIITRKWTKENLFKWQVHDYLRVKIKKKKQEKKTKKKHAVPCTSMGRVFIVSASETICAA